MKKTIASIAMLVSASSALAMPMPRGENEPAPKISTVCLDTGKAQDGSLLAGSCDQAENNVADGLKLQANGCAEDQVAIRIVGESPFKACMPSGVAQL